MQVKSVELKTPTKEQAEMGAYPHFSMELEDGTISQVQIDDNVKLNRHYHEIAEWYKKQKKKPFKFEF